MSGLLFGAVSLVWILLVSFVGSVVIVSKVFVLLVKLWKVLCLWVKK